MTRWVRLALLAVVLAALVFTFSQLDGASVRRALREMSWSWAAVAAVISLLGVTVDAIRWRIIVSAIRRVSMNATLQAQVVGIAVNVAFPFKLGEGARALALARREELPAATVVTTVLLDRVIDVATLPLFVAIASLVMPLPADILKFRPWVFVLLVVSVAAVEFGRWWTRRHARRKQPHHAIGRTLDRVVEGLRVIDRRHRLALAIGAGLLAWLLRAAVTWCMFQAFSLPLTVSAVVAVILLVYLGIAVVATPGNVGTFELATVGALALWGVAPEVGMSLAVAMHVLEVIPPAMLGVVVLAAHRGEQ